MRKKPLTFEAVVNRNNKTAGLFTASGTYLADLCPESCSAPHIPRVLLAGISKGRSHKVRITVERIED